MKEERAKKSKSKSNSQARAKSSVKLNQNSASHEKNLAAESQSFSSTSNKIPVPVELSTSEKKALSKEQEELELVKKLAGKAFQKKLECQQKLEQLPKQDRVSEFCLCINSVDMSVLVSYVRPPPAIKFLMQVFCMIWKVPPDVTIDQNHNKILDFWRPGKVFMQDYRNWLWGKECEMSPKLIKLIREHYSESPWDRYRGVSISIVGLVLFLLFHATRCEIQNEARPIKLELEKAETELKSALNRWKEIEVEIENSFKEPKQQ